MPFSLTVPKKNPVMFPVYLHKGSWREFKVALALHLKGCVKHWDSHLTRKIFMMLKGEEIRERFLSAFPPLSRFEKLDLSLDDIINPIEILEKKSHRRGCHPGRLTLDPEQYIRAWSNDRDGDPGYGYGDPIPSHMRSGFLSTPWGKHRLLDVSEDIENPHRKALAKDVYEQRHLPWGLQDMYFLGGVPLEYWCNGDSMGMHVRPSLPNSETYQWPGTAFRAQTYEEGGGGGDFSLVTECCRTYCFSRMWYLPSEVEWGGERGRGLPTKLFVDFHERKPRTWDGNTWWITGNLEEFPGWDRVGREYFHFAYIKYIQEFEDYDKVIEKSVFGERILNSQLSDTHQGRCNLFWGSPRLPPI
tara:strand:- start:42 stop:1118 length:1077 start_codon:yes stop_codon:yes gene_type:complete